MPKTKVYGIDILKSEFLDDFVVIVDYADKTRPKFMMEKIQFDELIKEYNEMNK